MLFGRVRHKTNAANVANALTQQLDKQIKDSSQIGLTYPIGKRNPQNKTIK